MKTTLILLTLAIAIFSTAAFAQTTSLQVAVAPQASITVTNGTTSMTNGSAFGNYSGTTNFTYKVRTTNATGTGAITMSMPDFSQAGGPSVTGLTYGCTMGATGTACTGTSNAVSISSSLPVASFGAGAHANGQSGSVTWALTDDPTWAVNTYTTTVTYTISAT
jgi:hypothetical protein